MQTETLKISKEKEAEDFVYMAFVRRNPPSILRLALQQLVIEKVNLKANPEESWGLLFDRAHKISVALTRNIKNSNGVSVQELLEDIKNARVDE